MVFDLLFLEPDRSGEFDAVFAEEMRAAGNVYLPFLMQDERQPPAPRPLLLRRRYPTDILKKPRSPSTIRALATGSRLYQQTLPLFAQALRLGYQSDPGHR